MQEAFQAVYRGKKVMVTGHTGFKGGWLCLWLLQLGAEVLGYSLPPPTKPGLFTATGLEGCLRHVEGDVRNIEQLEKVVDCFQPDMIFHLAAQPLVRLSYEDPVLTFETNVQGTVNLLEIFRKSESAQVFVAVTSDKCYENREWVWGYRECDPLGGHDPYSASKGCAELVIQAYRRSYFAKVAGKRVASVRAGNVIGGGDWARDRIVPDAITALAKGEKVRVRNPCAVRPWQYVLEPLSGYLWLGALMWQNFQSYSEAWNFGPSIESAKTVRQLVEELIRQWGSGEWLDVSNPEDFYEVPYLRLSSEKAHERLRWQPLYDFQRTIAATVNWYRAFYEGAGAEFLRDLCFFQIAEYCSEARCQGLPWSFDDRKK